MPTARFPLSLSCLSCLSCLCVLIGMAGCAQLPEPQPLPQPQPQPQSQSAAPDALQDRIQLQRQAAAWDAAIVRKDRAAIEANMAPDFRQIDARGNVEDFRRFVDGLLDPRLTIDPYPVDEFEIRLLGADVALLSGRTAMTGRFDGKPWRTQYRYIDVESSESVKSALRRGLQGGAA
jgi:ketosteroid isomerase-like protein